MRTQRFVLAGLVSVLAAAVAVGASASGAVARSTDSGPSCYPNHEFTIFDWTGGFKVSSSGSGAGNGGSASWNLKVKVTGNRPSTSGFFANPGTLTGSLSADVHVPGVAHLVHFTSHCISFAELGGGSVFMAAEGTVDMAPWSPGDDEAFVQIDVHNRTAVSTTGAAQPNVLPGAVSFSIAHAKTCDTFDNQYEFHFSDSSASIHTTGGFKGSGNPSVRGRAGLPGGVAPKNVPCENIVYD